MPSPFRQPTSPRRQRIAEVVDGTVWNTVNVLVEGARLDDGLGKPLLVVQILYRRAQAVNLYNDFSVIRRTAKLLLLTTGEHMLAIGSNSIYMIANKQQPTITGWSKYHVKPSSTA